ncbi:MAG: ComEC/Rec2 family competence protein [Hydrogenoanaerobacterium sp.]
MIRPLAAVGFTYVFAAMLAVCFSFEFCFFIAAVFGFFSLLASFSNHRARHRVMVVFLAAGVSFAVTGFYTLFKIEPQRELSGQKIAISGEILRVTGPNSVELRQVDGAVIAVSSREVLDVHRGDSFAAEAIISRYERGGLSPYDTQRAKLIPLRGFVAGEYTAAPPPKNSAKALLGSIREGMLQHLRVRLPLYQGDILAAMLLGEKQLVPKEIKNDFSLSGISHILAISGFHLAVIAAFLGLIFHTLLIPPRIAAVLQAACVFCYMALVGFSPSVIRAGVMIIISLFGVFAGRKADSLTSLAAAGLIICVLNPISAADVSFKLSFLATLGITVAAKPLYAVLAGRFLTKRAVKVKKAVLSSCSVTLCATAFTLPVTILSFGQVALYAPVTNILIAPFLPVAMICGFIAAVLGALPVVCFAAAPFAFTAGLAVTAISAAAKFIGGLPFASLPANAGFVGLWLAGSAVLVSAACVHRTRKKAVVCTMLCLISLFFGISSYQISMRAAAIVTSFATKNSVAQVIIKDNCAVVIGDINTKADVYAVNRVLKRSRIEKITLLAIAPVRGRRSGAVSSLFTDYKVEAAVTDFIDTNDELLASSLKKAAEVYDWGNIEAEFWDGDGLMISGETICLKIGGIKDFILNGKCDIIVDVKSHGDCNVAVFAGALPKNISKLRCDIIIADAGYRGGFAEHTAVFTDDMPEVSYVIKNGGIKLL